MTSETPPSPDVNNLAALVEISAGATVDFRMPDRGESEEDYEKYLTGRFDAIRSAARNFRDLRERVLKSAAEATTVMQEVRSKYQP